MFDYVINYSSNAHQVSREHSPTKGLYNHCQTDDIDLQSKSQVRMKHDYILLAISRTMLKAIAFKPGMTVDLLTPYMLILVSMTLTLMQGHSGSAKAKNQRCMLSATEPKHCYNDMPFLRDRDLVFANVYTACPACFAFSALESIWKQLSESAQRIKSMET